ncbi:MAG: hypothetical protein RL478_1242, partial [Actinomycetota bacterium]
MLVDAIEHCAHAFHLCLFWVFEQWGQWTVRLKMITLRVVGHPTPITIPDVFAPTKNLTNETFGTIDWNFAIGKRLGSRI